MFGELGIRHGGVCEIFVIEFIQSITLQAYIQFSISVGQIASRYRTENPEEENAS